jgi:hypothetical protein
MKIYFSLLKNLIIKLFNIDFVGNNIKSLKKVALFLLLFFFISEANSQIKSYKRGVSYGYHSAKDMQNFSKNISWWYNWAAEPDIAIRNTYKNYGVDFTPMAWKGTGINAVNNWVNQDPNVKYILGFNEPNFTDQANMTPKQAATAWPAFQAIADLHNLKTVGPAVNYCGNCVTENGITYNDPFKYLDDFFTACQDCDVDFIALHWYGGGNSIVGYVENARKYNKPIWVTEFAAWDNSVANVEDQKKYLAGTVNFLERDPDVYRYSWFIGRRQSGQTTYPFIDLYGSDGELTELGKIYMNIPVYDPAMKFQIPGRIEAEEYFLMSGLFSEITADTNGFLNIGWTDNNDWAEYKINVNKSGTYNLYARIAGTNTGIIDFFVDTKLTATLITPSTGGWQTWKTVSSKIQLEAGEHLLKMSIKDAGFNINWITISEGLILEPNNFNIEVIGETCPDKNNGEIIISAIESLNYKVNINGINYPFTSSKTLDNLAPGLYNICISVIGETFEQCYSIQIPEATLVSGKAIITSKKAEIEIEKGTSPYQVFVNGNLVLQTSSPTFNIEIEQGDEIQVKTAVLCEGVFSKTIDLFDLISVYPNPTTGTVEIAFTIQQEEVEIALYDLQSKLISVKKYAIVNGKIQLSLKDKPAGVYLAKINSEKPVSIKILKL